MSAELPMRPLLRVLLLRETGIRWWWVRLFLLLATGVTAAWMAGTWQQHHEASEPVNASVSALLHFEYTALFLCGLLAAVRVMLRVEEDSTAGWLPQYMAAGMEREIYAALLLTAVTAVALADYLLLSVAFAAGLQVILGSAVGWQQLAAVVLTAPLWLLALCSLAMTCQLLTGRSTASVLLFAGILLLPIIAGIYATIDQPSEIPLYVKVMALTIPTFAVRTSPGVVLFLLAYTGVLGMAILPLASWRIGRIA